MTAPPSRVLLHVPGRTADYERELSAVAAGRGFDLRTVASSGEADTLAGWPDIFLGAGFGPERLLKMPRLRWIQWVWAGVDMLMSHPPFATAVAGDRLRLSRAVGVFGQPIAEYALAWCLCLARDIPRALAARRRRAWDRFEPGTLAGKRLGVAGLGSVGSEVARLAGAFGLEVWGLKRNPVAGVDGHGVARVFGPAQILEFVSGLDYCVAVLPLTAETRGLFGAEVLASMRPSAVLVNAGRGATVDEAALVEALRAGRPGWAVLDVFEREPLPRGSPLWSLPNVVVTAHNAGLSRPADMVALFLRNLELHRAGRPLFGQVSGPLGY